LAAAAALGAAADDVPAADTDSVRLAGDHVVADVTRFEALGRSDRIEDLQAGGGAFAFRRRALGAVPPPGLPRHFADHGSVISVAIPPSDSRRKYEASMGPEPTQRRSAPGDTETLAGRPW